MAESSSIAPLPNLSNLWGPSLDEEGDQQAVAPIETLGPISVDEHSPNYGAGEEPLREAASAEGDAREVAQYNEEVTAVQEGSETLMTESRPSKDVSPVAVQEGSATLMTESGPSKDGSPVAVQEGSATLMTESGPSKDGSPVAVQEGSATLMTESGPSKDVSPVAVQEGSATLMTESGPSKDGSPVAVQEGSATLMTESGPSKDGSPVAVQEGSATLHHPTIPKVNIQGLSASPAINRGTSLSLVSPSNPLEATSSYTMHSTSQYERLSGATHRTIGGPEGEVWGAIDISRSNIGRYKTQRIYFSSPRAYTGKQHLIRKEHRDAARRILQAYQSESARSRMDVSQSRMSCQSHVGERQGLLRERARLRARVLGLTRTRDQLRHALKTSVEVLWRKDAEIKSLRSLLEDQAPP
ncbi:conserved hypothetical protein [Perkinsus marinus ATCC 50983]|uniref:Uncharacterized protein n=1 Tax=Perkinsus marinus (strain ATCC 50983 / TXsc) TaxID=423536 RepID=C5K773_PERM5|nr:conserved hypothetical protein [Perkinsus marinus ATCC 50983]EER19408.1 conserved hypothetical protein [Perkinsus marinus ATCC 50983]|eukprot:XP_002787612.1 conserved hypothetical protein [Perkinsus marinus ATCC 50983]